MTVTINGTSGVTTPGVTNTGNETITGTLTAGSFNAASTFGFKNRIINGAMVIDQRNAGASVTPTTDGQYTLDRWMFRLSQSSKFAVQQNAGSVTLPVGFTNYLGVTSSSSYSIISSDFFALNQRIEGYNIADLGWGTANAKTVTLSFQVYSSLTGTFGGSINNGTRSYPFSYTVSPANTWATISITIAGDTSGTWNTNNTTGLNVFFGIGVGSTKSGSASSWATAEYMSATGATSVVGTNGATFYITGVQLETGSVATTFDYRPYGTELALCQRYFEKSTTYMAGGIAGVTGTQLLQIFYKTTKRASATATPLGAVGGSVIQAGIDGFQISRTNDNPYATGGYTGDAEL